MKNIYALKQLFNLSFKIETSIEAAIINCLGNSYSDDKKDV